MPCPDPHILLIATTAYLLPAVAVACSAYSYEIGRWDGMAHIIRLHGGTFSVEFDEASRQRLYWLSVKIGCLWPWFLLRRALSRKPSSTEGPPQ